MKSFCLILQTRQKNVNDIISMKLIYKIFLVNLVVSFVLIFLMAAVMRFYTMRHFREDSARVQSERLTALSYELAFDVQESGIQSLFEQPEKMLADISGRLGPMPPPHLDSPPERRMHVPPPHMRLILLDAEKKQVAGPRSDPENLVLKPIVVNKETIGWIGLPQAFMPPGNPPVLKERLKALYTMSIIIFILAGVASYFLSRHILSPIDQMTRGTKQLARFKFDTRIKVKSKDELGQLAADFNRMAQTLQKYENLQKQWVADTSHELRTPVSILRGEVEAIRDGIRKPDEEMVESLHEEILHLEKIIEDLHLLSTADLQTMDMQTETISPVIVLKSVLNLFKTRFEDADLTLDVAGLGDEGVLATGDKDRLKQLFSNLLENHLKYTTRPGDISLYTRRNGTTMSIIFEDSGPGVPEESIQKLFDRLYRVDKSRSRKSGGTGLGLSICRAIAHAHNGRIWAVNSNRGGLKIILELPII